MNIFGFFVIAGTGFIYLWFALSPLAHHIRSQGLKRNGHVATATISFCWTGTAYQPIINFITNSGETRQSRLAEFNYHWLPDGPEFTVIYDPHDASFMEPDSASGFRDRRQTILINLIVVSIFSFMFLSFMMSPLFEGIRINFITLGALAGSALAFLLFRLRISRSSEQPYAR